MINDKADEVMEDRFQLLIPTYQVKLETSMQSSDFIFDCDHLLFYRCHIL